MPEEQPITRIYSALGNSYRRQIVELLRDRGRLGFKELHEALKISVGALYHHLEALEGVVAQDLDKKYVLTDRGRLAVETLSVSEERIAIGEIPKPSRQGRLGTISSELLFGRSLFRFLNEDPIRSLPLAILVVLLGGWLSLQTNLESILLFYLNPSSLSNRIWLFFLFPIGWLATFAVAETLSVSLFHRRGAELNLLNGIAFAMLPLLVVPAIFYTPQLFAVNLHSSTAIITVVPILLQAWIVCLLSAAISVSKGLRMERTALVSLGIMYFNILAVITVLQLQVF